MASELQTRTLVGVALAVGTLLALAVGGIVLWGLVTALAILVQAEWSGLMRIGRWRGILAVLAIAGGLAFAAPLLWNTDRSTVALLASLGIIVAAIVGHGTLGFGVAYIGAAAVGVLFLREHGVALALWTMLVVIATDVGAFFAGRAIGGPLLAPRISPKKTWAGLGGGMLAAALIGAGVAAATRLPAATLWLGAPLAIVAQLGDLYESHLKRQAGVKDSGRLLPGHGGVLDRVDGAIPAVIVVAALVAAGLL